MRASEDCRDLLSKILVADPTKRITIDGIYNHRWYLKGLPSGVREMNERAQPPLEGLQVGRVPCDLRSTFEPRSAMG